MIYQTARLSIRKLKASDINPLHQMQGNENVMKYTDIPVKSYDEDVLDLQRVIDFYGKPNNNFWIWAVVRKEDNAFLGTIALIYEDKNKAEVGFRFIEKYWNKGYGFETLLGLIKYAVRIGCKELLAVVYAKNIGSEIILRKAGFTFVKEYICTKTKLVDCLYTLVLK